MKVPRRRLILIYNYHEKVIVMAVLILLHKGFELINCQKIVLGNKNVHRTMNRVFNCRVMKPIYNKN